MSSPWNERLMLRDIRVIYCSILFAIALVRCGFSKEPIIWPDRDWPKATPEDVGMDRRLLEQAKRYALTGGGSGYIVRHGKLVMSWGDPRQRYDLKSTTKSFGATALGIAIADGKLGLDDAAVRYHPTLGVPPESNRRTGWIERITIRHLTTHTAGFEKPGGYTRLVFEPGTRWSYSDGGPNWLAECLTRIYQRDLKELMFERVFTPLGITHRDLTWRRHAYRSPRIDGIVRREFGSGISANVDAMARLGYLYLRDGKWKEDRILPASFVQAVRTVDPSLAGLPEADPQHYGDASKHYGLLWWNNADGTLKNVPRDAYWSWGLYDSLIVVIPSLDIVVARAGKSWKRPQGKWGGHYSVLAPFFEPIVRSVRDAEAHGASERSTSSADGPPYPPSPIITGIDWDPPDKIVRRAHGSDNWPITWGDDDRLYTAYGDGRGFRPFVEKKLSLGLAVVTGTPDHFKGVNVRSRSLERTGDGARGPKASGILMVDGVLYLLVRNVDNSQIVWSKDHGRTWHWCEWKFEESFGCPTFLNYGRNYAGARDGYVYLYSPDSDSAYHRADCMVLARVPRTRILDRHAYEFFVSRVGDEAVWSRDIRQRGSVFEHPGGCYRSSVVYHPRLRRYLWCQTGRGKAPRFAGGLAIYDAPRPWGPWTTVYFAERWDVGPGESSTLPTKWFDRTDGSIYLVFSGEDAFSVRRGVLRLREFGDRR